MWLVIAVIRGTRLATGMVEDLGRSILDTIDEHPVPDILVS